MAEILTLRNLKYADLLRNAAGLSLNPGAPEYTVALLANVVIEPVRDVLEYALRAHGINAKVVCGDYDNIVQDAERFREANAVIVFWEAVNLFDGSHHRIYTMDGSARQTLLDNILAQIQLAITHLGTCSLALFNSFSSLPVSAGYSDEDPFCDLCAGLNQSLRDLQNRRLKIVDLDTVYAQVSIPRSFNWRDYYSSKAPYSFEFAKAYVEYVLPVFLAATGHARKALIFDCDGTLWEGIIGEDGVDGIHVGPGSGPGQIFDEIQSMALAFRRQGILIGLCSKNNPEDVEEVLLNHPGMRLRPEHFATRKVNWSDKVTNLKAIASELSIGLDSLVFVDDSEFETEMVRTQLPEVIVLKVPERLHEYPGALRGISSLFYNLSRTEEDALRADGYLAQAKREDRRRSFGSTEEYLRSLNLTITVFVDHGPLVPRISQLTQKTNQFNLTTRRYTEADIDSMVRSKRHSVMAFSVRDCFGDNGVTGVAIAEMDGSSDSARLDTLLMSCRIIGRNVEYAFCDALVWELRQRGIRYLEASYYRTPKNDQVFDLYDRLGFTLIGNCDKGRSYRLDVNDYVPSKIDYIKVMNG